MGHSNRRPKASKRRGWRELKKGEKGRTGQHQRKLGGPGVLEGGFLFVCLFYRGLMETWQAVSSGRAQSTGGSPENWNPSLVSWSRGPSCICFPAWSPRPPLPPGK